MPHEPLTKNAIFTHRLIKSLSNLPCTCLSGHSLDDSEENSIYMNEQSLEFERLGRHFIFRIKFHAKKLRE